MKKSDRDFMINTLKDPLGSIFAKSRSKVVWIFSMSHGLEVEVHDLKTNNLIESYSCDRILDVVDSLINTYKSFKIDYEMCV